METHSADEGTDDLYRTAADLARKIQASIEAMRAQPLPPQQQQLQPQLHDLLTQCVQQLGQRFLPPAEEQQQQVRPLNNQERLVEREQQVWLGQDALVAGEPFQQQQRKPTVRRRCHHDELEQQRRPQQLPPSGDKVQRGLIQPHYQRDEEQQWKQKNPQRRSRKSSGCERQSEPQPAAFNASNRVRLEPSLLNLVLRLDGRIGDDGSLIVKASVHPDRRAAVDEAGCSN